MPQCPECSAGLPAGARFCGRCGAALPASEPDQDLTTPVAYTSPPAPPASPLPPVSPPPPAQGWADPGQGASGADQGAGGQAPAAGPGQQWGAGAAQQWGNQPAQQWGTGPAQQWGRGAGQQWGAGPAPAYPGAIAPQDGMSSQVIAGGVMAIVAALGIIAACALPVQTSTSPVTFGPGNSSISLFKELGNANLWWYLVEPIGVAVLALAAGIVVMASHSRLVSLLTAGILLGFGIQTAFLFLGYWRGFGGGQHAGPAGIVGILAGLLMAAAGLVAALAAARRT
jgi:hypothetical protein